MIPKDIPTFLRDRKPKKRKERNCILWITITKGEEKKGGKAIQD
jgi:hypothetical protein